MQYNWGTISKSTVKNISHFTARRLYGNDELRRDRSQAKSFSIPRYQ